MMTILVRGDSGIRCQLPVKPGDGETYFPAPPFPWLLSLSVLFLSDLCEPRARHHVVRDLLTRLSVTGRDSGHLAPGIPRGVRCRERADCFTVGVRGRGGLRLARSFIFCRTSKSD